MNDGTGVRGCVPQMVSNDRDRDVRIMFRPSGVFHNASAVAESGGKVLARKKAMIFTPGEMAVITIKPDKLREADGVITVRIEEG